MRCGNKRHPQGWRFACKENQSQRRDFSVVRKTFPATPYAALEQRESPLARSDAFLLSSGILHRTHLETG